LICLLWLEKVRTIIAQTPEMSEGGLWSTPAETQADAARVARNIELAINGILLIILFVAGCSLAVSAGGAIMERKRPFGLLRVAGMSIRQLRRVVLYESALPLLASTVLASAFGFLVAVLLIGSFTHPSDRTIEPPTLLFYGAMGLGICLALTAILTTMPHLNAVTKPEKARFE
jgi:ABC-type antimicrobial peptide transport system permease subunit